MKKALFCFPMILILLFFMICTILPYPIFSYATNLNKNQLFEINSTNETELSNISDSFSNILDCSWNGCINYILGYYTPYEIIDLESEQSFIMTRIGGKNHADMVPASKEDENYINSHFKQDKYVPVAVKLNEQTYIPACFCPYSHGYQNHYCLHFKNSKTDGTQKKDNIYQNVVSSAKQKIHSFISKN